MQTHGPRKSLLQVADLIKADRLVRLNAVVNEIAEERAQRFLGRTLEVRLVVLVAEDFGVFVLAQANSVQPLIAQLILCMAAVPKLWNAGM